ncbi:MAG: hypothetical protein CVV64_19735 [Candidatus Wallbacteria bacterium HGW-Wallbacteria-1]|uniref:Uncharacterized protein n=1 Tax=Candidatus Wallbacteria bacterium HGW-Wallbacteria-1 TaxID=2013854 RepID=A0A2N1PIQ9_9BACT|nr:MAG: hypothetical protein CVV64_19735 [Candidatus Wallbacteria bacterium HGW-Wallbacteria-1]
MPLSQYYYGYGIDDWDIGQGLCWYFPTAYGDDGEDQIIYNWAGSRLWAHGHTSLSRVFDLGKDYDNSTKVGMFVAVQRDLNLQNSGARVVVTALKDGREVGRCSAGFLTGILGDPPLDIVLPCYSYIPYPTPFVEFPLSSVTESFNQLKVDLRCRLSTYSSVYVTIAVDHIMISGVDESVEVLDAQATPGFLWLDQKGQSSGIVFRSEASDVTEIAFSIQTPSGAIISIGSAPAIQQGSEYVAKLSWWGQPDLPEGPYTIIAEAGSSSKSSTFEVKHTAVSLVGLGKWMKGSKDPSAVLPPYAIAEGCPDNPWDEMLPDTNGFFAKAVTISDPVNVSSGNFVLPQVDLRLKSRYNLTLARIYNSLDPRITAFGRGWSSPYLVNLEISADQVVFTNSDGTRLLFNRSGSLFTSVVATDLDLTFNSDTGFYILAHPHGSNWVFDSQGRILQMTKACCGQGANDAIVFSYDAGNKLSSVTAPSGKSLTFSYNAAGLISGIADSTGRSLSYTYDADSNLISFTDALNRETTYSYDEDGFMTSYTKPGNLTSEIAYYEHRVASIKDPAGVQSTFAWDFTSPKLTLTDFSGTAHVYGLADDLHISSYSVPSAALSKEFVGADGRVVSIKDSLNYSDHYSYDENGSYQSHTDKLGNVTTFTWHPTLKKLTSKTDALGRTWSYEWCSRGNLIKQTDPAGHEITYTYDSHNNRTSKTDALGHITRYVYDATGNYLVQTIDAMGGISSFTYDVRGNLTASTDQLGRMTSYEYDLIDRLIKSTYPDGRFTSITYDAAGNIASRIDNLGRVTAYTYDANGKLLTTTRPDNTVLAHAYDASGRRISSTDALNRVTAYEYDALDNMIKVTYPDQSYQTYVYDTEKRLISSTDELGNVTTYEYDSMDRMLATIDPAGSRWESQYDAAGRKIAAKDPLGRTTAYEYDVLDRVVKTTAPDSTTNTSGYDAVGNLLVATNALNQQTVYEYDALNRQIKTTQPNGAQFSTSYDAAGQAISETDALGNSTINAYDNAGRRVSTTNALNHVWQYVYDNAGRLVRTVDPMGGVATMTYDVMDRVITESDALSRVTAYEYDAAGKRIARTDAMGRRSLYGYDTRDRLTNEVDAEGRIVSHGYDLAGHKVNLTDGAGRIWRWVYDSLGRVTAEIDPLGNEVKSSYDAVDSLILKTNARAQATGYEYDLMNRLVKVNYPDTTAAAFSYDALGRELVRSGIAGTVTKSYDTVGNLLSETFVDQNKGWSYSYDLMGNKIQAVSPESETFKYRYDNLYRLTELESGKASEKISYTYDALGRNVEEKRVDSTTANTFDAAGQLLEMKHYRLVLDRNGNDCSHGHKGKKKKEPVYKEEILALRQYSYDLAGNRINMTDENGKVTSYAFDNSNWLTQVVYPNADVVTYAYNDAGDRISEQLNDKPAVAYEYDAAGRMISKDADTFAYDADGNILSDAEASYTWNSDNRLVRVEKTAGGCKHDKKRGGFAPGHLKHGKESVVYEEYTYLPQDWRRITRKAGKYSVKSDHKGHSKKNDEEERTFISIYDGDDESHEYLLTEAKFKFHGKCKHKKEDLKLFREFVGGPAVDDIEHTRYGKLSFAMLKDGLGSTVALTGRDGKVIANIGYDAWGNFRYSGKFDKAPCKEDDFDDYLDRLEGIRSFGHGNHNGWAFGRHFGSKLTPYLYTGRRHSALTNQYFNRNRYYSPALGRFTSKDPIGFNGGPQKTQSASTVGTTSTGMLIIIR